MAIGPCEHVDAPLVQLVGQMAQSLYACAGALRTLISPADEERHALREILTASVAIAATEAEALVSLCSIDLCAPARIHARSLGDLARRFLLLPGHRDIAKQMYDAGDASRREMFRNAPADHPARVAIEATFQGDPVTMEILERRAYEADDQSSAVFMDRFEARYLSKWNHADIIALCEAGNRLLAAGDDVQRALGVDSSADFMLYRAGFYAYAILFTVKELYRAKIQEDLDDFLARLSSYKPRFDADAAAARAEGLAHLSRLENRADGASQAQH
jgi:hypothetical protein